MEDRRNRKHRDPLLILLHTAAVLGWLGILAAQIVAWLAAPEMNTGIVRYHELELRQTWLDSWGRWLPYLLALCSVLSITALIVSPLRSRRRSDSKHLNLILLLVLTLTGLALYYFSIQGNSV